MLIHRLKVARFLSFGPEGVDLPMAPLNVLIGPNGSGKSNFLEAIALLKDAPRMIKDAPRVISDHIAREGGVRGWIWKGPQAPDSFTIEAHVGYPSGVIRHAMTLADRNGRPEVTDEQIEFCGTRADTSAARAYYRPPRGKEIESYLLEHSPNPHAPGSVVAHVREDTVHFRRDYLPTESLISRATPNHPALWHLNHAYPGIELFRDWSFGPSAASRIAEGAHERSDFLNRDGSNLALTLSNFAGENKRHLVSALQKLYDGIVDISCPVTRGTVALFLEEVGDREIAASRLSDGTLRYLALLAILLHPEPPRLVAIEEPELGLHPDLLPTVSDLLRSASKRTQLVVTTHSDVLVDALTDVPESVVVCEKHNGQTEMRRLDRNELATWLEKYRLGELWTSGELGGNRW